jgi:hypothetical protein
MRPRRRRRPEMLGTVLQRRMLIATVMLPER